MRIAEDLTGHLKKALGDDLISVVLYGSAAAGDQSKNYSDVNILVVVTAMGLPVLKKTMPIVKKWTRLGNHPPLFFTKDRIQQAEDVFPMEFLDIKANHKILWGDDPFCDLKVHTDHLRHQLEYELRGKLIQLRERYLETNGIPRRIQEMLAKSISTFVVLFKGVLRLLGEEPPAHKQDVISTLSHRVPLEKDILHDILRLRENDKNAFKRDPEALLEGLLKSVEAVVDFVDQYKGISESQH